VIWLGALNLRSRTLSDGDVAGGHYQGRALSDVYDSGEIGNPRRGKPSCGNADSCRELSTHAIATASSMLYSDVLKGGEGLKAPRGNMHVVSCQ
jgi:hypothetical protein